MKWAVIFITTDKYKRIISISNYIEYFASELAAVTYADKKQTENKMEFRTYYAVEL